MKRLADIALGVYAFAVMAALACGVIAYMQLGQARDTSLLSIVRAVDHLILTTESVYNRDVIGAAKKAGVPIGHAKTADGKSVPIWQEFMSESAQQAGSAVDRMRIRIVPLPSSSSEKAVPADRFITQALSQFMKGRKEYYSTGNDHGTAAIRYAKPLFASAGCRSCENAKGSAGNGPTVGDGQISAILDISFPIPQSAFSQLKFFQVSAISLGVVLLLGFLVVIPLQYHQKMRSQDLTVRARKMEVAATTDPLTGLYNRRYFEQALREYLIEFNSINAPLAVLVFDLDHFKAVNDNHGHDAGDLVLKEVSSQLRQLSREHDVVARIGGEEFAIVAPFASDKQVVPFAKRYCKSIAKLRVHLDEATIRPTVSIGVAITTEGTSNVNELMKKADERLYEAKRNGRNRVAA